MLKLLNGTDIIVISGHIFGSEEVRTSMLMAQKALGKRVYFFNRPLIGMTKKPTFYYTKLNHKVTVVQPFLPSNIAQEDREEGMMSLMRDFILDEHIHYLTIWTDTPEGMPFIRNLNPDVSIYDKSRLDTILPNYQELELIECSDVVINLHTSNETLRSEIKSLDLKLVKDYHLNDTLENVTSQKNHLSELTQLYQSRTYAISRYQKFY